MPLQNRGGAGLFRLLESFNFTSFRINNLIKRNLFIHVRSRTRVFNHVSFSTISSVSQQDSDFNVLISKINIGKSEDEVFQSLLRDPDCNTVKITDILINKLLHRFKDDWKSALGVFRWAQSVPEYKPSPEIYDILIDILGKMKQMEKMNAILFEMREKNRYFVSLNTVGKVMRRLSGAGKYKEAVKIFDELKVLGLEKNTESMNLLLDTLCKEKKVEYAREVFLSLKADIPPNAHTFNIFINGWCNYKRVEEAYWTIEEMKGFGFRPCVITYSIIIQSYCKELNFDKVYEVLDDMAVKGAPPNIVTFTTIMCELTKAQKYDEAIEIYNRMRAVGLKPDTLFYNALIHTMGRAGRVVEAVRVFETEMGENMVSPNGSTYNSMIAMFCHHGKVEKASRYLKELENSRQCEADVKSYYPLLKACFKKGNIERVHRMVDDMVNKRHLSLDLATYTLLIHGFCKGSKGDLAYVMFEEMIVKGIVPRYQTCRLLLNSIKETNMYEAAEFVEEFMKKMKSM